MGQVNLYKIDENKRIGFLDQLRENIRSSTLIRQIFLRGGFS